MQNQHTSGEWEVRPTGATSEIHKAGERSYYIATVGVGISDANTKANARLIAAAPDLLVACEAAYSSLGFSIDDESLRRVTNQLADALAKARRETPKTTG